MESAATSIFKASGTDDEILSWPSSGSSILGAQVEIPAAPFGEDLDRVVELTVAPLDPLQRYLRIELTTKQVFHPLGDLKT